MKSQKSEAVQDSWDVKSTATSSRAASMQVDRDHVADPMRFAVLQECVAVLVPRR